VDDGFVGRTLELWKEFGKKQLRADYSPGEPRKAAALTTRFRTQTPDVVTIDADTEIETDAIRSCCGISPIRKWGAVAGNVKVGNRSRWLTRCRRWNTSPARTWRSARLIC